MAALIPNIAKGKAAYYAGLPDANDALIWILYSGSETDANLKDADTVAAIEALTTAEATFTGYARVTATNVVVTVDDTGDQVTIDADDPSWSPTSAEALTRIVLAYDPDTTVGTDTDLIPVFVDDFSMTTPTSGTITYQVASGGFYTAS